MTRRERLEAKLEKREEWAAGRRDKAAALRSATPDSIRHDWAFITQPGHIPERARMIARDDRAMEHSAMAAHHVGKAAGLADQLDRCIFSDDENAIEAIREKIAGMETERDAMKRANAVFKKGGREALAAECGDAMAKAYDDLRRVCPWETRPFPAYSLTNLGANIRRMEKRIEEIERRNARTQAAEQAGGVVVTGSGDYINVTFAEKPERAIIDALKAAGFGWCGGSWGGYRAKLPACVLAMIEPEASAPVACICGDPDAADMTHTSGSCYRTPPAPTWDVRCDDCKATLRATPNVRESYAGGRCDACKATP